MKKKKRIEPHGHVRPSAGQRNGVNVHTSSSLIPNQVAFGTADSGLRTANGKRPRVLFAVGDAECDYTQGKILRLAQRLQAQTGWDVVGVVHDEAAKKAGEQLGLPTWFLPIQSPGITMQERLLTTNRMIDLTSHLRIPGSDVPLWKILAMDDFVGSLHLFGAYPDCPLEADLLIVPLIGVDNNTPGSCGLYSWLVTKARAQGIPVLGLEVSPLGNKHMLGIFPADHYAVKSEWGKNFLLKHGIAQASQVSVLKVEEAYLLWTGQDEYVEAYLETEPRVREALHLPQDEFVIGIPHHVTFLWEVRNILKALIQVPPPLHVVIRANPRVVRRQYPEREIVRKAHEQEIHSLPHVVVDETVGVGLLLQLADLMICPFAGTATERAALCRKPVVICQAAGEEGWAGEYLYWEPHPENLPALIQAWREQGRLDRFRFAHIASGVLREPVRAAA